MNLLGELRQRLADAAQAVWFVCLHVAKYYNIQTAIKTKQKTNGIESIIYIQPENRPRDPSNPQLQRSRRQAAAGGPGCLNCSGYELSQ